MNELQSLAMVKDYYGRVLQNSSDLKTSACCVADQLPIRIREIVSLIHPEVLEKFYGCGVIAPAAIEGHTVLDLGSGSGRDVYVLAKLVGAAGKIIGMDMTDAQLNVARRHQDYHAKIFGYEKSNVSFLKGYIEDLDGIASNSVDMVVSNCVINLSPAKERVFKEVFRVLKPGGELHFSDVFADRRLHPDLATDAVLLGECLGGALYIEDFRRIMTKVGCHDYRILSRSPIVISDPEVLRKTGLAQFTSFTVRAFKLDLEDRCEDHGQVARYRGTIADHAHNYTLDDHHMFVTDKPMLVCGNTAKMLTETRLRDHFQVDGDTHRHFGLFDCGPMPGASAAVPAGACC